MYLNKYILMISCLLGSTAVLANEYIEMSFQKLPDPRGMNYLSTIGKNGDFRFVKINKYLPFYNTDLFYIKGVGLFEAKINKDKSAEYTLYGNMIYSLSKKSFNNTEKSTKIKMFYRSDDKEYTYKVDISSGIGKDEQVKKLDHWFKNEHRSMLYDQEMSFKAGVLMRGNVSFRDDKVYIDLFIENPTKQNVEIDGFKSLSLSSSLELIQVRIVDKNNRYIFLNLDGKYLINNENNSLKINSGKEVKQEFVYSVEEFFNILNTNENSEILKNMLSSDEKLKIYMVVRNRFVYPSTITGKFLYHTFEEDVDIRFLKRFN